VAELHRLQPCRRCRHLFVATPGERLCPDCRREAKREQARRALFSGRGTARAWRPVAIFALGSVGLGVAAGLAHLPHVGLATWLGGAAALAYIARTSL
jgi:hypothetical protein